MGNETGNVFQNGLEEGVIGVWENAGKRSCGSERSIGTNKREEMMDF